jgi:peptidyl-tRNA hydrolase, PTH1 family
MIYPVVGLGNPGADYQRTRHNVGFWVVQKLADKLGLVFSAAANNGAYVECHTNLAKVAHLYPDLAIDLNYDAASLLSLVMPMTYMNRSGDIWFSYTEHWSSAGHELAKPLVCVDQMDLNSGMLRLKSKGGTAGHNGLKSLVEVMDVNFNPLYIGIGRPEPGISVVDHVLGVVEGDELLALTIAIEKCCRVVAAWVLGGTQKGFDELAQRG